MPGDTGVVTEFSLEQIVKLTSNVATANANMENLDHRFNDLVLELKNTNYNLKNICKDCEPSKFVRASKKLQWLVVTTVLVNLVTLGFAWWR